MRGEGNGHSKKCHARRVDVLVVHSAMSCESDPNASNDVFESVFLFELHGTLFALEGLQSLVLPLALPPSTPAMKHKQF